MVELGLNFMSQEKYLQEARKALAVHMEISSKSYKNAKGEKIVLPPPITCLGDRSAMFDCLQPKNDKS